MLLSFAVNDNKSVWHCRLFVGKKDEAELMKPCKSCVLHFYNLLCESKQYQRFCSDYGA